MTSGQIISLVVFASHYYHAHKEVSCLKQMDAFIHVSNVKSLQANHMRFWFFDYSIVSIGLDKQNF